MNYKNKGLYRSVGIQNVADPGDTHQWRFYVSGAMIVITRTFCIVNCCVHLVTLLNC